MRSGPDGLLKRDNRGSAQAILAEMSYLMTDTIMSRPNLHTKRIVAICGKYHVATISLFGSMARNEATEASDIDLLVSFSRPISLLQLVTLERELSDALGRKVDPLTEASLSPYLRDHILKERQLVYAA
jgi:predicted nucleotidyltransferase